MRARAHVVGLCVWELVCVRMCWTGPRHGEEGEVLAFFEGVRLLKGARVSEGARFLACSLSDMLTL